ncbi:hypothetical protein AOLI_G00212490 [Acnodon oligacanthus]
MCMYTPVLRVPHFQTINIHELFKATPLPLSCSINTHTVPPVRDHARLALPSVRKEQETHTFSQTDHQASRAAPLENRLRSLSPDFNQMQRKQLGRRFTGALVWARKAQRWSTFKEAFGDTGHMLTITSLGTPSC